MNEELLIREENSYDIKPIFRVNEQAFETNAEARLVDLLRDRGKATVSLVAEVGGQIVGHILFSPVSIEPPARNWIALGLAPLAVTPRMQRQGIGGKLIKAGLQRCQELGFELVVVLGHPTYYPKFGFRRASEYGLANEYQADEAFMAIELLPGVLTKTNGLVKYAPEFNELDF